jgi:hypothetical protein
MHRPPRCKDIMEKNRGVEHQIQGAFFFSVVVPKYRRSHDLTKLIEALTLQTFAKDRFQVIIVADGGAIPSDAIIASLNYMMASKALLSTIKNLAGLSVHEDITLKNMVHANVLGQTMAKRLMIAMYKKTGENINAYDFLNEYAKKPRRERRLLEDVLVEEE